MAATDSPGDARKWRRLQNWILMGLVAIAIAAGGAWYVLRPPQVTVAVVSRGPAVESVYASGVVDFVRQARISPVVSSPIRRVLVAEGAMVAQGQVLAELVDGPERAGLMQLLVQAELAGSVARRTQALYDRGYAAEAARDNARREWLAAIAAANAARARLADYYIRAPFPGRVMRRDAEPGDVATPGTPLFVIADPATLRITADIDERDAGRLTEGLTTLVQSDAFPGRTFNATVVEITPLGDASGRVFRARLSIDPETPLRAGMTVEANIVLARRPNAVLAPTRAIADGRAWVVQNGRAHRRTLRLGVRGADRTEVLSGLAAGERVILDPPARLREGAAVRIAAPAR